MVVIDDAFFTLITFASQSNISSKNQNISLESLGTAVKLERTVPQLSYELHTSLIRSKNRIHFTAKGSSLSGDKSENLEMYFEIRSVSVSTVVFIGGQIA